MRKKFRREAILFLLLILFSGGLFFLDKKGWLKPVRSGLEKPILFTEGRLYQAKVRFSFWVKSALLGDKLTQLQGELQRLVVDQNQLAVCQEENEKMRRLLGAPLPAKWKFIPAHVSGVSEEMRLDKGEKDGLRLGMNVVEEKLLVGKIISLQEHSSLVQTPFSPGVKIPVLVRRNPEISGEIQARGLLISQAGEKLILDRVLQSEDIQKGDLVVTLGEADWLPDLLLGRISEVQPKSAALYQKALVDPLLDYQDLRTVFVISQ